MQRPSQIGNVTIPQWWDCKWRRVPCGRNTCQVCTRIAVRSVQEPMRRVLMRDRFEVLVAEARGVFPPLETWIEQEIREEAAEDGYFEEDGAQDIPEPEEFDLFEDVRSWMDSVVELLVQGNEIGEEWVALDMGKDLAWYASTLVAKTYRQLVNRMEIECGEEMQSVEYMYTQYVIAESVRMSREAMRTVRKQGTMLDARLGVCEKWLEELASDMLTI